MCWHAGKDGILCTYKFVLLLFLALRSCLLRHKAFFHIMFSILLGENCFSLDRCSCSASQGKQRRMKSSKVRQAKMYCGENQLMYREICMCMKADVQRR